MAQRLVPALQRGAHEPGAPTADPDTTLGQCPPAPWLALLPGSSCTLGWGDSRGTGPMSRDAQRPWGCPTAALLVSALSAVLLTPCGSRHRHGCGATTSPCSRHSGGAGGSGPYALAAPHGAKPAGGLGQQQRPWQHQHQPCRATPCPTCGLPGPAAQHNGPLCEGTGRSDKWGRSTDTATGCQRRAAPLITGWLRSAPVRKQARRLPPVPESHSWDQPRPARLIR